MSKIPVVIDYVKMAQYQKCIEYYLKKIQEELDSGITQKEDEDE